MQLLYATRWYCHQELLYATSWYSHKQLLYATSWYCHQQLLYAISWYCHPQFLYATSWYCSQLKNLVCLPILPSQQRSLSSLQPSFKIKIATYFWMYASSSCDTSPSNMLEVFRGVPQERLTCSLFLLRLEKLEICKRLFHPLTKAHSGLTT